MTLHVTCDALHAAALGQWRVAAAARTAPAAAPPLNKQMQAAAAAAVPLGLLRENLQLGLHLLHPPQNQNPLIISFAASHHPPTATRQSWSAAAAASSHNSQNSARSLHVAFVIVIGVFVS